MLPCLRFRSRACLLTTSVVLLLSSATLGDATVVATDQARWKDGELIAPLPLDETLRNAAVAEARAKAASRPARTGRTVVVETDAWAPRVLPSRATPLAAPSVHYDAAARARWLGDLYDRLQVPGTREGDANAAPLDPARGLFVDANGPTVVANSFDGIDDTGWDPGAPDIAVGPDHIVIATTDRFTVMDKCGNTLYTNLIQTFFGLPGTRTYYTPKVIYDEWTPRWVLVFIGTESNNSDSAIYIAASETANPLDGWHYYTIGVALLPGLKDGPAMAVTPDELYVSYNQFNLGTFAFERAVIFELVKADVYASNPTVLYNKVAMMNPNDGTLAFSVHPAQMHSYAGIMYFVNSKPSGDDFFTLWELDGPPGGSILTGNDVATFPAYAVPPDASQPNATLVDTGDCRIRDATYRSGHVYASFTRANGAYSSTVLERFDVDTLDETYIFLGGTTFNFCPAIDVDENDQVTMVYARCSVAQFLSAHYMVLSFPLTQHDAGTLFNGLGNFSSGSQPYRWGPYFGAATDPSDDRTVWIHGTYASTAPANSWTTRVGAVTVFTPSDLSVELQSPTTWIAGFEGGPFAPSQIDYELTNTGATAAHWLLESVPAWLTPSAVSGSLDAGASQNVSLVLNATADGMPSGIYNESVIFSNCTGNGGSNPAVTLAIGLDGSCPGAQVSFVPDVAPAGNAFSPASTELGAFVTAIRDVSICAVGIEATVDAPVDATVHIYAADGNTRGALLASSAPYTIVFGSMQTHVIPMDFDFTACGEYDVAVEFADAVAWPYWNEPGATTPLDAGGAIRVRNGETDGNAADPRVSGMKVFMDIVTGPNSTDLAAAAGYGFEISANQARGNFVIPERTMRVHSLGLEADLVPGTTLTARIYSAAGAVRTGLIAEGTTIVVSAAFQFHDVPISAVLLAGAQYDIEVEWENSAVWGSYSIPPAAIPYTVANTMTIYGTETGGVIATDIPHLRLSWSDETPAFPFTLAKPGQPLPSPLTSAGTLSHGAYITSLIDQEVYGVGVMADIPDGGFITAYLYRANGTIRGPLITTATVISDGGGMQWHDIPISATLFANNEYDLAFSAPTPTSWPYWLDTSGLPYDVYGTFRVRDAEAGGVIGTAFLAHMRVHGCSATLTPVADGPRRTPMMLAAPAPNPSSAMVRFGYSVDEAGDVEIAIYDVAGKRVAQVARKRALTAGPDAVDFDTSKLASGVYFVKLSTPTKSAARKFVVTH